MSSSDEDGHETDEQQEEHENTNEYADNAEEVDEVSSNQIETFFFLLLSVNALFIARILWWRRGWGWGRRTK